MQWEQEVAESKYAAGLEQLEQGLGRWGRRIPADASLWHCDETGTRDNLWLNLGTGFIGSGRQAGTCQAAAWSRLSSRHGWDSLGCGGACQAAAGRGCGGWGHDIVLGGACSSMCTCLAGRHCS